MVKSEAVSIRHYSVGSSSNTSAPVSREATLQDSVGSSERPSELRADHDAHELEVLGGGVCESPQAARMDGSRALPAASQEELVWLGSVGESRN